MKRTKKPYTIENLMNALQDVKDGKYNVTIAARVHSVPRQTLADKIKGKSPAAFCKPGPHPLLGVEIEENLRDWALDNTALGFITTKDSILFSVRQIIESNFNPSVTQYFKNRSLGTGWYKAFKKRYPEIVLKKLDNFKYPQITKSELQTWFHKVRKSLGKNGEILLDPERIFCMGQLPLTLNSAAKTTYSQGAEKETTVLLLTANVEAKFAPAMITFKHFSSSESNSEHSMALSTCTCVSTGKSQCQIFYSYIVDVFYPYLVNSGIELPIVVFADPRIAHFSYPLREFCRENNIHVIPFLPNASNFHPFENGFFQSFCETWKTEVKFWPARNNNENIREENIETVIANILQFTEFSNTIKRAFRTCGIFPFDVNAVDCHSIDHKKPQPVFLRSYYYNQCNFESHAKTKLTDKPISTDEDSITFDDSISVDDCLPISHSSSYENIAENYIIEDFIEETIEEPDHEIIGNEDNHDDGSSLPSNSMYQSIENEFIESESSTLASPKREDESQQPSDPKRRKIQVLTNMAEKSESDLNITVENILATPDDSPEILRKKNKDLQGLLEKVIDLLKEKSNVCLNLEKQNSALNLQITSLKDIVSITKNLLSIRNVEVENMQKDMSSLQDKINVEKERHNKMIETVSSANKLNEDIKGEYQNQMSLFQQLRDKYNEKVSLLSQENQRLKTELQNLKNEQESLKDESS